MTRAVRAAVASLIFAMVTLSWFSPALAQDGATLVAIVTPDPSSSLTRRVRDELEGLGVDVIVIRPPAESTPSRTPLEQAARGVGAIAAVRLVTSGTGVEVWVADRATGKAVVRELVPPPGQASDAFFAVGVVELLRASLMELHTSEPRRGDAPVTPKTLALALPSTPSAPSSPPRIGLSVGGGVELGVRGLGPSIDADLAVWIRIKSGFALRGSGALTLADAAVTTSEGKAEVGAQRFGVEGCFDLAAATSTWVPTIGVGVMGAHVAVKGTAAPPLVGQSLSAWAAGPMIHAGLGLTVARGLRVRLDATGAFALPTPQIFVVDTKAARWGAPLVGFSLGLELLSSLG